LTNRNDILLNLLAFNDVIKLNNAIRDGSLKVRVTEKRRAKGVFYQVKLKRMNYFKSKNYNSQRLDLHDFPFDVQELSINLAAKEQSNQIIMLEKVSHQSLVNLNGFRDQQQWKLFNFVSTCTNLSANRDISFTTTAYIARYPNYYIYK
jgi:hypothetical protein